MFCSNCGKQNPDGARFCESCGNTMTAAAQQAPPPQYAPPPQPQYAPPPPQQYAPPPQAFAPPFAPQNTAVSTKSKTTTALLCFFLGWIGIHRFYTGKTGTAIVMIIMLIAGYATYIFIIGGFILGALGLWVIIDFIMILTGKFKDKNGLPLK
jgi:TM2 domain-containing membrane protein YozV